VGQVVMGKKEATIRNDAEVVEIRESFLEK
jgi:hypothetical protein